MKKVIKLIYDWLCYTSFFYLSISIVHDSVVPELPVSYVMSFLFGLGLLAFFNISRILRSKSS
jgi:hypothetical protein